MSEFQMNFERCEIKYLLSSLQYQELKKRLNGRLEVDQYGKTTICNIYFDTSDSRLIRESLEKPVYKEKLRLRSYGTPRENDRVFLELKKKYKGIVYKRREDMSLSQAEEFLYHQRKPERESQVVREIQWFLKYYDRILPAMYLSYERTAMYGLEDARLRITFDENILWRVHELRLKKGDWGQPLLEPGQRLMEIKILEAMPLWLGEILDELSIYPASFSKYGRAYEKQVMEKQNRGGIHCA